MILQTRKSIATQAILTIALLSSSTNFCNSELPETPLKKIFETPKYVAALAPNSKQPFEPLDLPTAVVMYSGTFAALIGGPSRVVGRLIGKKLALPGAIIGGFLGLVVLVNEVIQYDAIQNEQPETK